jgi:hypothetical protein
MTLIWTAEIIELKRRQRDCDLECSRGLQPAFGPRIMLQLSAPERGLKPATTCLNQGSGANRPHLPGVFGAGAGAGAGDDGAGAGAGAGAGEAAGPGEAGVCPGAGVTAGRRGS